MKTLLVVLACLMSLPTFAVEILSCKLSEKQTIKITKESTKFFYSTNGSKPSVLAGAVTLQAKDIKKETMIKNIIEYTGLPASQISRANVYTLRQDDDGGQTIIRFIFKDETYIAAYVSMGRIAPCH